MDMKKWTPRDILARTWEVLRTEGVSSLWFKILGETCYRRMVLFERRLDDRPVELRLDPSVVASLLSRDEVDEYVAFHPGSVSSEIRSRLQTGQLCFIARHEGRIVNATWAATSQAAIDYLDAQIHLMPGDAYLYSTYTAPEFRGRRLASSMRIVRHLRGAGYQRSIAAIMAENKPALRMMERSGYSRFGMIGYFRLGPWRRLFRRLDSASRPIALSRPDARSS